VAGGELDQVLNALRNAKPGVTPAQAIADAGLNQPTVQSLLKNVATRDPKFFTDLLNTQDFATVNKLSQLAGGETATASRNTLANAKAALNAMTGPQRDAALNRANLGKAVVEYEQQAGQLSKEAAAKVQIAQSQMQFDIEKMRQEAEIKKDLMNTEFQYNMQLKGMEIERIKQLDMDNEKAKDDRTKIQATQQSKLIEQRQKDLPAMSFESAEDSLDGFDLEQFNPR
jgi:hypothetical protein